MQNFTKILTMVDLIATVLIVSACGTPAIAVNPYNPGAAVAVTSTRTATSGPVVSAVPSTESTPGMTNPTSALVPTNAAPAGTLTPTPSPTELVMLYGTPTTTPNSVAQTPQLNVSQVPVPPVQNSTAATAVTLQMNEYSFQVDGQALGTPLTLKSGMLYDLTIKNVGNLGHEIWFGRNLKKQDGRIDGYSDNLFTGVDMAITTQITQSNNPFEVDTTAFYEVYLNPTESVKLEFTLPASTMGNWEVGCFQLFPGAKPASAPDTSDNMAMTPSSGATAAAAPTIDATADTSGTAVAQLSHYDIGMKLPVIVQ